MAAVENAGDQGVATAIAARELLADADEFLDDVAELLHKLKEQGHVEVNVDGEVDVTDNPVAERLGVDKIKVTGSVKIKLP
jgi:pentose-5-phosphate-3-epimerase